MIITTQEPTCLVQEKKNLRYTSKARNQTCEKSSSAQFEESGTCCLHQSTSSDSARHVHCRRSLLSATSVVNSLGTSKRAIFSRGSSFKCSKSCPLRQQHSMTKTSSLTATDREQFSFGDDETWVDFCDDLTLEER